MYPTDDTIYLDHAATTPVRPEVAEAMSAVLAEDFGNPSSGHAWGRRARWRLEEARDTLASSLGLPSDRVLFTRGGHRVGQPGRPGTGAARSVARHPGPGGDLRDRASRRARGGGTGRDRGGHAHGRRFRRRRPGSGRLGIGACEAAPPLDRLVHVGEQRDRPHPSRCGSRRGLPAPRSPRFTATRCRRSAGLRSTGETPPVDLLTITGHKIGGPKGSGALIARDFEALRPLHFGGGQERGLRPGTEDVAGAGRSGRGPRGWRSRRPVRSPPG